MSIGFRFPFGIRADGSITVSEDDDFNIRAKLEIFGMETRGDVNTIVQGNTGFANSGNRRHRVNLSAEANNVVFTQSNDGTGHVR